MNKVYNFIILVLAGIIILSFFLPWVIIESQVVGTVSKVLTGKRQVSIDSISGFRVPVIANGPDARLMVSIIKVFNPSITDADKKSYLVWAIPLLSVVMLLVSLFFGKNKWVNLAFGLIGTLIFIVAVYKIKTTDLNKLVLNVNIASGLWLTLWGYLGIGLVGLANFFRLSISKAR